jgi:drug/metabolite transporter (DMT)-like permease
VSQPPEYLRGIVLLVLSASLFAVVDGLSKILAETQSVGQIVWARYALALLVLIATTPRVSWAGLLRTARPGVQILRGATPIMVSGSMVLAVHYLPLADATVILFLGPFLVVALSGALLGEHVRTASWIGVAVGFVAVILVARPGFNDLSKYAVFPFIAAVFYALLQLFTRRLGAAGERPDTTLAWTLAVGGLVATPVALATWQPTSAITWLLMISLGLVFGFAQLLMIRAFTHAPAGVLAPFSYAQVIAATIVGVIVFGAVPDVWTLLGIAMIIGAGLYVIRGRTA